MDPGRCRRSYLRSLRGAAECRLRHLLDPATHPPETAKFASARAPAPVHPAAADNDVPALSAAGWLRRSERRRSRSSAQRRVLGDMYESNKLLAGKRVLIVDDDVRNIFALTSVLEQYDMAIVSADNGRDAIQMLDNGKVVDVVLMDIMMPEMDGLDTTREIRRIPTCKNLPIIAVTAKAMKGDRDRCLEAGAWDYLSKPVDTDQLLAVLRLWLQR